MNTREKVPPPSKAPALCLAAALMLVPCIALAQSTVTDGNSALRYNLREPFALGTVPSSPVQFPGTIEWTVDGRRILVYPSIPGNSTDVEHIHPAAHVAANQIHVQGPLFGYAASAVTVGIVYTVTGGSAGSGVSRISEKIDIRNKSASPVPLNALTGLGWLPDPSAPHNAGIELPDLSGLTVTGTTMAFTQGDMPGGTARPLITDAPFGPVSVIPGAAFTGFNPFLRRNVTLQPGATLTIITELSVGTATTGTASEAAQNLTTPASEGAAEGASMRIPDAAIPGASSSTIETPSGEVHRLPWKKKH